MVGLILVFDIQGERQGQLLWMDMHSHWCQQKDCGILPSNVLVIG